MRSAKLWLENRNSHYLATNQLALLGRNNDELIASISKFMADGDFADDMRYAQNEFVVPDSDKVLGDIIIKIAQNNRNSKVEEQEQIKKVGLNELENLDKLENTAEEQEND